MASASLLRRVRPQRSTPARSKGFCAISTPSSPPPAAPTPMRRPSNRYSSKSATSSTASLTLRSARGGWSRSSTSSARDSTRSRLRLISIRSRRCCVRLRPSLRRAPLRPSIGRSSNRSPTRSRADFTMSAPAKSTWKPSPSRSTRSTIASTHWRQRPHGPTIRSPSCSSCLKGCARPTGRKALPRRRPRRRSTRRLARIWPS